MLLTLSVGAFRDLLVERNGEEPAIRPRDLPRLASEDLGLNALHLPTSLLKGWPARDVDGFRDAADKAGCPCLVLEEDEPHPMANQDDAVVEEAVERMRRVLRVAHRLGCSSVAMTLAEIHGEEAADFTREHLRDLVKAAERLELNLLVTPSPGITEDPEELTALVRDVGGFRIGTCPSFAAAAATGDPASYLKTVAPYASAIVAQTGDVDESGDHPAFDLCACIDAIQAVGYDGSLAVHPVSGDPVEQARRARDAITEILETESA
jgi:sugar phosphate isomerase/epimerase